MLVISSKGRNMKRDKSVSVLTSIAVAMQLAIHGIYRVGTENFIGPMVDIAEWDARCLDFHNNERVVMTLVIFKSGNPCIKIQSIAGNPTKNIYSH